jgi:tetratricopeptide (TPR) repeat protein
VPDRVLTPDEADRIAYVADSPRRVDRTALDSLTVVLAESRRLEDAAGSASLIEPARGHLQLMERLTLDVRGPIRPAVVDLAGQWSQFVGWLSAALGQLPASRRWFDRTLEWATEADNPTLIANALSFKGHLAWMRGFPGPTVGLSQAAQRDPAVHSSQLAFDALQEAKGHAMAGSVADVDRKLENAERLTAVFAEHPDDVAPWSYYYTPALFTLERALAHRHLGRHQTAADLLSAGLEALPPEHRGAEWTGDYRRALAQARRAL